MPPKRWRRPSVTVSQDAQDAIKQYAEGYGEDLTDFAKVIARRGRLTEVQRAHVASAQDALDRGTQAKETWREFCKIVGGTVLGIVGAAFFTEMQDHADHPDVHVLVGSFIVGILSALVIAIGVWYRM